MKNKTEIEEIEIEIEKAQKNLDQVRFEMKKAIKTLRIGPNYERLYSKTILDLEKQLNELGTNE